MTINRLMFPPRAESIHAFPRSTAKAEQDERSWRAGYAAAFAAKLAGKPTPRAPQGVDRLSYASGAVEGAAAGERELDPKDVLRDLFEQELVPDPAAMTDRVIRHLRDAGFKIVTADDA